MKRSFHAVVYGQVQMVGFRYFVVNRATELGLTGCVRNSADRATVEVVAEGEEGPLRQLERALRTGPRAARVDRMDIGWSDTVEGFDAFNAHT